MTLDKDQRIAELEAELTALRAALAPDWNDAPDWVNYAAPVLLQGMDGPSLMWEYYETPPRWGKKSWNWVSGWWGATPQCVNNKVLIRDVIGLRHMLKSRPHKGGAS